MNTFIIIGLIGAWFHIFLLWCILIKSNKEHNSLQDSIAGVLDVSRIHTDTHKLQNGKMTIEEFRIRHPA